MSLAARAGLPDAVQTTLFVLALLFALTPYFSSITIAGVHLRLNKRKQRLLRIIGPILVLTMIALVFPFDAFAPPPSQLHLLAADATDRGEIDLAIGNSGKSAALLTRIELEMLIDRKTAVRPVLTPSALYVIPMQSRGAGHRRALVIRHLIAPNTTERIIVSPATNRAMRLRIHLHAAGGEVLTGEVELWPAP